MEITKLSSKGQVVIPREIREKLKLEEGTLFSVNWKDESICLRKIKIPKIKTWKEATFPFKEAAKKSGLTKEDIDRIITEVKAGK